LETSHESDFGGRLRSRYFAGFRARRGRQGLHKGSHRRGVAGHMAGHGKLGAAAGCAIGHHQANKPDANKANAQPPAEQK